MANHKVKITGVVVNDYDFGLALRTPEYEYYHLGESFKEFEGYNIEIKLKHWNHKGLNE